MIISHSRKFTFVHIRKAGGTSVQRALDPYLAWNDLILGGSPLGERMQGAYSARFDLNKHSSVSDIERVCGSRYTDEYYLFALVRHPVARICSLYNYIYTLLHKWARHQNIALSEISSRTTRKAVKKAPMLNWSSSRAFLRSHNFSEFLRQEDVTAAPGFCPQTSILSVNGDGRLKGEIFRLEDSPRWVGPLGRRLGIEFDLPHVNQSRQRLIEPKDISDDDCAFIAAKFESDYAAFGYDR